jgi:hypothetical protein
VADSTEFTAVGSSRSVLAVGGVDLDLEGARLWWIKVGTSLGFGAGAGFVGK